MNKLANKSTSISNKSRSKSNINTLSIDNSKLSVAKKNSIETANREDNISFHEGVLNSLKNGNKNQCLLNKKSNRSDKNILSKINILHLDKEKLQKSLTSYCSDIFTNALQKSNLDSYRSNQSHKSHKSNKDIKTIEKENKIINDKEDNHPNIKVAKNFLMESLSDGFLKELVNKRIETDESLENFTKKFKNENKFIKNSFIKSSDKFKDKRIQKAMQYYKDEMEIKNKAIKVSK